jgi:hypothetical protein
MSRPTRQAKSKALAAFNEERYECPPPLHQRLLERGITSHIPEAPTAGGRGLMLLRGSASKARSCDVIPKPSTVGGRGLMLLHASTEKPGSSGDGELFQPLEQGISSGSDVDDDEFCIDDSSEYDELVDLDDCTETSSSDDEAAIHETLTSRNELIVWSPQPTRTGGRARSANIIRQRPGPTRYFVNTVSTSPKSIFTQFITEDMIQMIVSFTNQEGRTRYVDNWNNTCTDEIYKFIDLVLLAGVYTSKNEAVSQLWNKENGRPIFSRIMPRNRFSMLSSCIRFDDRSTRNSRRENDKLTPFHEIWSKFITRCKANFIPGSDVTVDEQLVTFRGRCPFKMYIPSKPGRYGVKIWILADTETKYCYNAEIYIGKVGNVREVNQATRVVLELSEPLSGSGRNVVGDNFFSSLQLIRCLEQRKLTYFGTIRKNKPELPVSFQPSRQRQVESSLFGFHGNTMIVSYVPKKNKVVNLISSAHDSVEISNDRGKPQIIIDYNHSKCGVDSLDQLVRKYSCKRKTLRWPMALFFNMVDIASYNAFVIFGFMNPGWNRNKLHRRRIFLIQLAQELAGVMDADPSTRVTQKGEGSIESRSTTRRRCKMCNWQKDKKSVLRCETCADAMCKEHSVTLCRSCFIE